MPPARFPQTSFITTSSTTTTPVGGVWIDFTRNGEMTKVSTLIKVKAKLFFLIPILNYRHQSEEIWVEDSFHRFTGRTVDNGRATDIRITPNGEGFDVNKNGDVSKIATPLLSPAIWCEGTLKSPKIFSPLKGRMKDVRSEYLGEAVISAAGRDRADADLRGDPDAKGKADARQHLVRRGWGRREGPLPLEAGARW